MDFVNELTAAAPAAVLRGPFVLYTGVDDVAWPLYFNEPISSSTEVGNSKSFTIDRFVATSISRSL